MASQQTPWLMLTIGSTVGAPYGTYGLRPATVNGLGQNHDDHTIVELAFDTGGTDERSAGNLYWRKPELKRTDKPNLVNQRSHAEA